MALTFKKDSSKWGTGSERNVAYLWVNNWDDYSFKTTFQLTLIDSEGISHKIYGASPRGASYSCLKQSKTGHNRD